jgi:UDP-N-acetylmuramoylalanine-D-glutamate ligase
MMLEKIVGEFHSIVEKYLQSEKNLTIRMKRTMLVNLDESSDEDVNMSQQQKQLMQANANETDMLRRREEDLQKIESDVMSINQIMNEISTLISGKIFFNFKYLMIAAKFNFSRTRRRSADD